jgi:plastocyanin
MNKAIIALIIVVIIGAGTFALTRNSNNSNTNESTQPIPANTSNNQQNRLNEITYDGKSFSPSQLIVESGATVTIKNTSSRQLQMQSDPHPAHTDDPDLNVGTVAPGQSKTFTVTQKGTFGYHDHLNPSEKGTISIE